RDGVRELGVEGAPEGEHPLPDAQLAALPEAEAGVPVALDLEDGDVAERVGADDLGAERAPVEEDDLELVGLLDDVVVRDDVAVGADEGAAAEAVLLERLPGRAGAGEAEEVLEGGALEGVLPLARLDQPRRADLD